ncbi:MAG TPA: ABC transporter permease [Longimicrobiales bacterium]|nr:ABC transporter permease [Longimicrobiales bacterium]
MELKQAARSLARRPGFTIVAALTLALGIAANVAIFAVINGVLLRPLPYPESERIVSVMHHAPGLQLPDLENSPGTLALYRQHARSFSSIAGVQESSRNLTGGLLPVRVQVAEVSPSWFDVMQVQPLRGRRFVEADADTLAAPVAVLTHEGWQAHFGGREGVLGSLVEIDGTSTEIIGILPPRAYTNPDMAAILPSFIDPNGPIGRFGIIGVARLAPGVTLDAARTEVEQLQARIPEQSNGEMTAEVLERFGWSVSMQTLRERITGDIRPALLVVLGTVAFLLLVACASVANLFLVRAESRQRESGLRLALGASRARLAASFLSESMLLGLGGGIVGLVLAAFGVRALIAAAPAELPRIQEVSVDASVLLFALVLSVVAGLLFGLLPLPQQLRAPLQQLVRDGRGSAGRDRQRMRKTLIVAQIALALVLLTGSMLMLRSFERLRNVDPGVNPDGVLTLGVSVGDGVDRLQAAQLYQRMTAEAAALPGVTSAGVVNALPLDPEGMNGGSFELESRPRAEDEIPQVAFYSAISAGYFEAIGTTLLQGRSIERADTEERRSVVWVSESFARDFLDGKALGERVRFDSVSDWMEIVGVVRDVRTFGLREPIRPMVYVPMTEPIGTMQVASMTLVLRTTGDPAALAPAARAAVQRAEPNVPITTARTMAAVIRESMADTAFTTTILMIAAVVALLLGAIGLYGVIGYVVTQRTQEIGVRIAIGARPEQVRTMVLREGLVLALIGIVIGTAAAAALTRGLERVLYEVNRLDPLTFVVVPLVLLLTSALAAWVPARRAAAIAPLEALRSE